MRKRWIGLLLLVLSGGTVWQNKIDFIAWALPKAQSFAQPTAANRPIAWQAGPEVAALAPAERPPNIILVLTDDMGFNDISLYNGGAADGTLMTPHIDALAQQGVTFTSGHAGNAVCAPSRASMLTGRYSTRFGFEFTPVFRVGPFLMSWIIDELDPDQPQPQVDLRTAIDLPSINDLGLPPE